MRSKQSGFTLVEIAIVLVIIGLLLGGVLKGQELINSAKVKNMAVDFRNIPLFIYGYQDKYKALPGDHATAATVLSGASNAVGPTTTGDPAVTCATNCRGNGVIDGVWNSTGATVAASTETEMFWAHVRLAGLAAGPTSITDTGYYPTNADGGRIGIESGGAATGGSYIQNGDLTGTGTSTTIAAKSPVSYFTPTYLICSTGILGKYAKQLDTTIDDGEGATGSIRIVSATHTRKTGFPVPTALVVDSTSYIVCMGL
jgi:prepilin-type N-terminal cleavage/methylation domain-containing protein